LSRSLLPASLQQTEEAVRGSFVTVARSAQVPANAEQLRDVSAAPGIRASRSSTRLSPVFRFGR